MQIYRKPLLAPFQRALERPPTGPQPHRDVFILSVADAPRFTGKGTKVRKKIQGQRNKQFLREMDRNAVPLEKLAELLKQGADVNARTWDGSTALHLAAQHGQLEVVEFLVAHGAGINLKNNYGYTALHQAVVHEQFPMVAYLVTHGAQVNALIRPLHLTDNLKVIQLFLNQWETSDPQNTEIYDLLLEALRPEHLPLVNALITKGYKLPAQIDDLPILEWAITHKQLPLFKLVYEQKGLTLPEHSRELRKLLIRAIVNNQKAIALYLAEQGAPLDTDDQNIDIPLQIAASKGFLGLVNGLLDHGADPNLRNSAGATALHAAAGAGRTEVVKTLLARGADPTITDNDGNTPRRTALFSKHLETASAFPQDNVTPFETGLLDFYQTLEKTLTGTLPERQTLLSRGAGSAIFRLAWHPQYFKHVMKQVHQIESNNDQYLAKHQRQPIDWHPLEAELLLLLSHPQATEQIEVLTGAITSIYDFIRSHGIGNISGKTIENWKRLGLLTHRFLAWKYDAIGGKESLLAKYGFDVMDHPRNHPRNHQKYGDKSFILEPKPDNLVALRRGYLLISTPKLGTLVIRNSSPAFGRGLMCHPAYYSAETLSRDALLTLDPATDSRFRSALDPSLYKHANFPEKLETLSQSLLEVTRAYARWKFDGQAFVESTHPDFVGHKLDGFQHVVRFLNELAFMQGQPLPDLAFVSRHQPLFFPFAFTDHQGKKQDRFSLTSDRLEELNALAAGTWSPQQYPHSDLIPFLQMGIQQWGELIFLEPNSAQQPT